MAMQRIDLGINLKTSVDNTGIKQLENSLNQLQEYAAGKLKLSVTSDKDKKNLTETLSIIGKVQSALKQSYNTDLGYVNITKFNASLKNANTSLDMLRNNLLSIGSVGVESMAKLDSQLMLNLPQQTQRFKLLDSMAKTMTNTVKWGITASAWKSITTSISGSFTYAKALDSTLNDIRIVTDKSAKDMEKFAVQANKAAKALSVSTQDYTKGSLLYYQQGLSDSEVAARTETTMKVSNVTGQDTAEVASQLTAVWNGYQISVEQSEEAIDKLAAVAASSATDLEYLSTAMSKVASSANQMGISEDQLVATISTIGDVTQQSAETVGTALKTIYARLGDLAVDGVDEFGVKLGTVSAQLKTMGINILDSGGEMRDMGTIIEEVAGKWDTWSEAQKQAASVAMAGKRQYNNLIALFENWDKYEKMMSVSEGAAGTLEKQQSIYAESLEAQLTKLNTEAERTKAILFDQKGANSLIKVADVLLDKVNDFIEGLGGGLRTLITLGNTLVQIFSRQLSEGLMKVVGNVKIISGNRAALEQSMKIAGIYTSEASMNELKEKANSKKVSRQQRLDSNQELGNARGIANLTQNKNTDFMVAYRGSSTNEERTKLFESAKTIGEAEGKLARTKAERNEYGGILKQELTTLKNISNENKNIEQSISGQITELEQNKKEYDGINSKITRINEDYTNGAITEEQYIKNIKEAYTELNTKIENINKIREGIYEKVEEENEAINAQNTSLEEQIELIKAIENARQTSNSSNTAKAKTLEDLTINHSGSNMKMLNAKYTDLQGKEKSYGDLTANQAKTMLDEYKSKNQRGSTYNNLIKLVGIIDQLGLTAEQSNLTLNELIGKLKSDAFSTLSKLDPAKINPEDLKKSVKDSNVFSEDELTALAQAGINLETPLEKVLEAFKEIADSANNSSEAIKNLNSKLEQNAQKSESAGKATQEHTANLNSEENMELQDAHASDLHSMSLKQEGEAEVKAGASQAKATKSTMIAMNAIMTFGTVLNAISNAVSAFNDENATKAQKTQALSSGISSSLSSLGMMGMMSGNPYLMAAGGVAQIAAPIISVVGSQISKKQEKEEKRKQEAEEKAIKEMTEAYEKLSSEISKNDDNLDEFKSLQEEFDTLKDGISATGQNINLTASEYDRYLDIQNKVQKAIGAENAAKLNQNNLLEESIALLEQENIEKKKSLLQSSGYYKEIGDIIAKNIEEGTAEILHINKNLAVGRKNTDKDVINLEDLFDDGVETKTFNVRKVGVDVQNPINSKNAKIDGTSPSGFPVGVDRQFYQLSDEKIKDMAEKMGITEGEFKEKYVSNAEGYITTERNSKFSEYTGKTKYKGYQLEGSGVQSYNIDAIIRSILDSYIKNLNGKTYSSSDAANEIARITGMELSYAREYADTRGRQKYGDLYNVDTTQMEAVVDDFMSAFGTEYGDNTYAALSTILKSSDNLENVWTSEKVKEITNGKKYKDKEGNLTSEGAEALQNEIYSQYIEFFNNLENAEEFEQKYSDFLKIMGDNLSTDEEKQTAREEFEKYLGRIDTEGYGFINSLIENPYDSTFNNNQAALGVIQGMKENQGWSNLLRQSDLDNINKLNSKDNTRQELEEFLRSWDGDYASLSNELKMLSQIASSTQEEILETYKTTDEAIENLLSGTKFEDLKEGQDVAIKNLEDKYYELGLLAADRTSEGYKEALRGVQEQEQLFLEKTNRLQLKLSSEKADEAFNKLSEGFEKLADEDIQKVSDAIDDILEKDYTLEVQIKADLQDNFDDIMSDLSSVSDLASKIGDNFIVSADDVEKLGETFPGILENIKYLSDGTVQLNKEAVDSAIQLANNEKAADVEVAVSKLELAKQEVKSKMDSVKTLMDLSQKLSTKDGQNDKNLTEYKNALKEYNTKLSQQSDIEISKSADENAGNVAAAWTEAANASSGAMAEFASNAIDDFTAIEEGDRDKIAATNIVSKYNSNINVGKATGIDTSDIDNIVLDNDWENQYNEWATYYDYLESLYNQYDAQQKGLLAKYNQSMTAFGNVASGKGSDGKLNTEKNLERQEDLYYNIELLIANIKNKLEEIQDIQKNLVGDDLTENLKEQLDLLNQQKEAELAKYQIQLNERATLQGALGNKGVTFNAAGDISNYNSFLNDEYAKVNALTQTYNKSQAETDKQSLDIAKEKLQKLETTLNRYKELNEEIKKEKSTIRDVEEQIFEITQQKMKVEIELALDTSQAERDFIDFKKNLLDKDEYLEIGKNISDSISTYVDDDNAGDVQKTLERLLEVQNELNKGDNGIYAGHYQQGLDDLDEAVKNLMTSYKSYDSLLKEVEQNQLDAIENVNSKLGEQNKKYDNITKSLQHQQKIISLIYGDSAYNKLKDFYDAQNKINNSSIINLKNELEMWKAQLNSGLYEEGSEAYKKISELIISTQGELDSLFETSLENLKEEYANTIQDILDVIATKKDNTQWEYLKKTSDLYLDNATALYNIQEMNNKIVKEINKTVSQTAKARLEELKAENQKLRILQAQGKLSQDDVDRMEKVYNLTLAQIALEEAQNNKTSMRLTRDSQGNYTYNYVADEDKVADAQEQVDKASYELYEFDNERLMKLQDNWIELRNEMAEALSDTTLTEEERAAIIDYYESAIAKNMEEYEMVKRDLASSTFQLYSNLYEQDKINLDNLTEQEKETIKFFTDNISNNYLELRDKVISNWNEMKDNIIDVTDSSSNYVDTVITNAIEKAIEDTDFINSLINSIKKATEEYGNKVDEVSSIAGEDYKNISNNINIAKDNTNNLNIETQNLIKTFEGSLTTLANYTSHINGIANAWGNLKQATIDALQASVNYYKNANSLATNTTTAADGVGSYTNDAAIQSVEDYLNATSVQTTSNNSVVGNLNKASTETKEVKGNLGNLTNSKNNNTEKKKDSVNSFGDISTILSHELKQLPNVKNTVPFGFDIEKGILGNKEYISFIDYSGKSKKEYIQDAKHWSLTPFLNGYLLERKQIEVTNIEEYEDSSRNKWIKGKDKESNKDRYKLKEKAIINSFLNTATFNTGGYTGEWSNGNTDGKLAMLHQKELILNAKDTERILNAVSLVRDMGSMLSNIKSGIQNRINGITNLIQDSVHTGISNSVTNEDTSSSQNVTIYADFPNAESASEIKIALDSMVNKATQYSSRS